ncbi:MAG: choice-of-anchor J domain-containing protein, partial [Candidatus Cloacimonetes bacterium]|nr:choice-of-anchor J domain-containing protein [Candidatus Cloacimonadota bacterium]
YATITLPLTTYDTQTINVKFIGTWGAGDYYFDLDNIIVREPPDEAQFAINPTLTEAWAFGTIQTGFTLKKQFTITNTGAASLNISSISTSDAYYGVEEIAPIDHALTAGESTSFYATFTPTVVGGPYSGTVTVTWSSGTRETYPISFTGSGVDYTITTFDPAYTEGFESVTAPALPGGWTVIDNNADGDKWITSDSSTYARTGTKSAQIYTDYNTANDDYLVTPPIVLTENQELRFWARSRSTSEPDEISVLLSTTTPTAAAFTTVLMPSTNLPLATYSEFVVDLSAYSGTCYISFTRTDTPLTGDGYYLNLDDVTIREIPDVAMFSYSPSSIEFPFTAENSNSTYTNVVVSNIGGASLDLIEADITIIGTDADQFSWDTVNMPASLTAGQSVNIPVRFQPTSVGTKTATLRISYAGTDYDVALSGYAYGSTALFESFEGATFPPAGWANPGSWSRSTYTYYSGAASAYLSPDDSGLKILSAPKVTITGSSSLSFMSYCSSSTATWDVVYSPDRSTWTQVTGSSFTHPTTSVWVQRTIDLSSLAGNNYYLGIRAGGSSYSSYYVDNLLGPEVTAEAPGPVTLSLPADAASPVNERPTFTWTAPSTGGIPTGYAIYCAVTNPPNYTTDQIGLTAAGVLTFTPVTALNYNTTYYWTVKAYNATGDATVPTPRSFTTRTDPVVSTFPWSVDFGTLSTDAFPPLNWSKHSGVLASPTVLGAAGTGNWIQDDWKNVTTPANKAGRINIYSTFNGWLVSPPIAVPAADYEVKFDVAYMAYGVNTTPGLTGTDDQFAVLVGDGTSWTPANVVRQWDNAGSTYVLNDIPPAGLTVSLPLGTAGTKYIAFYGISTVSNVDNDLMIDNVIVRQTPVGAPHAVTLTSPTNGATGQSVDGFNLTWTPALTGGAPTSYRVYMATDEGTMFEEYSWVTTNPYFNPVTEGLVTFGYLDYYYWTVKAINDEGDATVDPAWSFEIQADPAIVSLSHTENFDSVTAPAFPGGWAKLGTTGSASTQASSSNSSPNCLYMYNGAVVALPIVNLTA